jgi:hypothetical protein
VEVLSAYLNPAEELHMLPVALGERQTDPS